MLTITSLMVSAIGVIYRIYLARYLGAGSFGLYAFITTFIAYFGIISMFGFRNVVVRQIAAERDRVREYARVGVEFRLASGTIALILALVLIAFLHKTQGHQSLYILCAISLPLVGVSDILDAVLLGLESSEYSAISALISNMVKIGAGMWLLVNGYGLFAIFTLFIVVAALNLLLDWLFLRYRLHIRLIADKASMPALRNYVMKEALPFWYMTLITKVYYKNDVIVLGLFKGDTVVGWYGGAYMAIDMLLLLAGAVGSAIFPIVSRIYSSDPEKAIRYFEAACKHALLLCAPACLFISVFGPRLIPIILGKSFVPGMDALPVLIWMVLFETIGFMAGTMLSASGDQRRIVKVSFVVSIINVLTTIALVMRFSYMGAAWATTSTSVLNFFAVLWMVKRCLPTVRLWKSMAGVGASALVMGIVMLIVGRFSQVLAAVCAFGAYAIMLAALNVVNASDVSRLKQLLAGRRQSPRAA
jgi:O-antigen/teichoic acid export membrane protein